MRWVVPLAIGVILLLVGIGWAAQGAGIAGSNTYMDNNRTFVNLGGVVAVLGVALIGVGIFMRMKTQTKTPSQEVTPS